MPVCELLPGTTNVVRFPIERRTRPTLELLREIAPDVRRVSNVIDAFDLEMPALDLRDQVDADTAGYIATQLPRHGAERDTMLAELLEPVVRSAVSASRASREAWDEVAAAQDRVDRARRAGDYRIGWFEERVEELAFRAAELMLTAYVRSQEAEGVARAVWYARNGETWRPFDAHAEAAALFGFA
jgi:hypothetical protein